MRRRSELCDFRFEHVEILPNGRKAILLARSKTDQYGDGKYLPLSDELYDLLMSWKAVVRRGFILRGITTDGDFTTRLHPVSLNRCLQSLQAKSALELPGLLSGHSFRVGRAIDLLEEGESIAKIMLRGGWKSEKTAMRYLRFWSEL